MRRLILILLAAGIAGCAPKPAKYALSLSHTDPKFSSPECLAIRESAVNYNDKVGERVAIGLASGLLLGPFGLVIAAGADAEANEKRKDFAREVHLRCSSLPLPKELVAPPPIVEATDTRT